MTATLRNGIVCNMTIKRKKFVEAESREGMRALTLWLPGSLHRELALARVEDSVSMNEMIRAALRLWLTQRKRKRRAR